MSKAERESRASSTHHPSPCHATRQQQQQLVPVQSQTPVPTPARTPTRVPERTPGHATILHAGPWQPVARAEADEWRRPPSMVRQAEGSEIDQGLGMDGEEMGGGTRVTARSITLAFIAHQRGGPADPDDATQWNCGRKKERHHSGSESNSRSRCPTVLTVAFGSSPTLHLCRVQCLAPFPIFTFDTRNREPVSCERGERGETRRTPCPASWPSLPNPCQT